MRKLSSVPLRTAVAALVLSGAFGATAASAQTPEVSGAVTGPGIEVAPTTGTTGSTVAGESIVASAGQTTGGPVVTGAGEVVLGVQAQQLPRTGGLALDPALGVAGGVALSSLGFYFRLGRKAQKG